GFEIPGARFDGGDFRVRTRFFGCRFDNSQMVEVPRYRALGAEMPLAKQYPDVTGGTVQVVRQALDNHRHPVRSKAFIGELHIVHPFARETRALLDRPLDTVL